MTILAILLALTITIVFVWALWRAEHLDENTLFFLWLRCKWRGKHRPVRHPLGGFRCLDCLEATMDLDAPGWGHPAGGYVDPDRRTYQDGRGA